MKILKPFNEVRRIGSVFSMVLAGLTFFHCNHATPVEYSMSPNLQPALQTLSQARIFFGHQSVGGNLLGGLQELAKSNQVDVKVVEYKDGASVPDSGPILLHAFIGENYKPDLKCADFKKFIANDALRNMQLAMMKFCYVDVNGSTDVAALFESYSSMVETVKASAPSTRFVHFTIPLTTRDGMLKSLIKKVMGKDPIGALKNKNHFNRLLREKYGQEPIFDLARLEATRPDGTKETFEHNGETLESLVPDYTHDGGHLGPIGRKWVAEGFAIFMASQLKSLAAAAPMAVAPSDSSVTP